jgi:hypothetical protein
VVADEGIGTRLDEEEDLVRARGLEPSGPIPWIVMLEMGWTRLSGRRERVLDDD